MKNYKQYEYRAHTVALLIALLGPLITLTLRVNHTMPSLGMYLYWGLCLSIYVAILIPVTYKTPLTFFRLIILGIIVEDFASHTWRSLISGNKLLPFSNWYIQHFPFLGSLGEPTPFILIPRLYIVALFLYFILTAFQFRENLLGKRSRKEI